MIGGGGGMSGAFLAERFLFRSLFGGGGGPGPDVGGTGVSSSFLCLSERLFRSLSKKALAASSTSVPLDSMERPSSDTVDPCISGETGRDGGLDGERAISETLPLSTLRRANAAAGDSTEDTELPLLPPASLLTLSSSTPSRKDSI